MKRQVRCFLLPSLCNPAAIAPNVIVIDVLRASTTICAALSHGARAIYPFLETQDVIDFAQVRPAGSVLSGGERGGEKVAGFHLGNSPLEYSEAVVTGKEIAFSTTNGTKAMQSCLQAKKVLIGAFCNFSAVCNHLAAAEQIDLICAGTNGEVTLEDSLFAGAVVDFFSSNSACHLNDQAQISRAIWNSESADVCSSLKKSRGGKNLIQLGKEADIEFAALLDSFSTVPELDIQSWKIEPA